MTNSDRAREEWLDANDPDRVGDWAHTSITVEDGWHHDQCRECGLLVHRPDCSALDRNRAGGKAKVIRQGFDTMELRKAHDEYLADLAEQGVDAPFVAVERKVGR